METVQEMKNTMNNQSSYRFNTDTMTFDTVELKGEKQAYVTGYISVPEVDLYNDLVTMNAMNSLLKQIEESVITIDYEHEAWRDDNSILPVAKIVEAKVDDKGLWVKAILNKNSPKYKALWGSIKDGFINAFSIAFQPLLTIEKEVDGVTVRLIEELRLLNVAFTGAPVNKGATMTEFGMKSVMLKAITDSEVNEERVLVSKSFLEKLMEVKDMEEKPIEEPIKVEVIEEPVKEEVIEEPVIDKEKENNEKLITELKALVKDKDATIEKQKTELKDLEKKPVFKSHMTIKPEVKNIEKSINMLSLI